MFNDKINYYCNFFIILCNLSYRFWSDSKFEIRNLYAFHKEQVESLYEQCASVTKMKAIFLRSRICISEIAYNTLKFWFANKIMKYILLYFRLLEALKFSTISQSVEHITVREEGITRRSARPISSSHSIRWAIVSWNTDLHC